LFNIPTDKIPVEIVGFPSEIGVKVGAGLGVSFGSGEQIVLPLFVPEIQAKPGGEIGLGVGLVETTGVGMFVGKGIPVGIAVGVGMDEGIGDKVGCDDGTGTVEGVGKRVDIGDGVGGSPEISPEAAWFR
jgi:hypothetical protein